MVALYQVVELEVNTATIEWNSLDTQSIHQKARKMTDLPFLNKFPSFTNTIARLKEAQLRCIWYLPKKGRTCMLSITTEEGQRALHRANEIWQSGMGTRSLLQYLASIVEDCCCARWHRNKVWGTGLSLELAELWYKEIRLDLKPNPATLDLIPSIKEEHASTATSQAIFAKHQLLVNETLLSKLQSDIDPCASKSGSIYFYTYASDAFSGMIKIGYTSKAVLSRLDDWAQCGYGDPKLLGSLDNVRHPERVELLIHFELMESWQVLRWCKHHRRSHIEWFRVEVERVCSISQLWQQWMEDANPYDRRGHLQTCWQGHVDFLVQHGNPITAAAMMQIQEIEADPGKAYEFINDEALRGKQDTQVKEEDSGESIKKELI